ncbi:MAG: SH3 domain-containing protein [Cyanobacteria bacterium P01_H01_bin.153]
MSERSSEASSPATTAVDASRTTGQTAKLTAADPQAQINVRSQPSSVGEPIGYGRVGETVVLGRSEAAEDGYTWHRVTFQSDGTVGWIRGDLLDIQPLESVTDQPATAAPVNQATSDALKQSLDDTCGSTKAVESYFVTASNTIYICKVRNRRTYLSQEAGTEQVIQAEDVEALGGGYIIGNDNFEYRLDASSLVVVRFDDSGQQEEILREPVIHSERY